MSERSLPRSVADLRPLRSVFSHPNTPPDAANEAITPLSRLKYEDCPTDMEEVEWLRFLLDEGLEALAAYRTISNPALRAMYVRLMKEAAKAGRNANPELH